MERELRFLDGSALNCYPLKFFPVYKDYIWGGRNLELLGRRLPAGKVAESWEVSGHPDGVSIIANGEYRGMTLPEFLRRFGSRAAGRACSQAYAGDFPLLVKLIDAEQRLSVQVHPDDEYAALYERGQRGKNEMWYIISAAPGAQIVYGLRPGITREKLARAIEEERVEDCLRTIGVQAGDVIDIPPGTVHALGAGIVLAEIQQSSNLTYRIYDYGRRDARGNLRPLHIEQALKVIDFSFSSTAPVFSREEAVPAPGAAEETVERLASNRYFTVEKLRFAGERVEKADGERFFIYMNLRGRGTLRFEGGALPLGPAESFFIPASLGVYSLTGPLEMLRIYLS